jgi:hypothetical protein
MSINMQVKTGILGRKINLTSFSRYQDHRQMPLPDRAGAAMVPTWDRDASCPNRVWLDPNPGMPTE